MNNPFGYFNSLKELCYRFVKYLSHEKSAGMSLIYVASIKTNNEIVFRFLA